MNAAQKLIDELILNYGAVDGAMRKVTLEGMGQYYFDCAVRFKAKVPLGMIFQAERFISGLGMASTVEVVKGVPSLLFSTLKAPIQDSLEIIHHE